MEINKDKIRRAIELLNEAQVLLREEAEKEPLGETKVFDFNGTTLASISHFPRPLSDALRFMNLNYNVQRLTEYVNG